MIQPQQFFPVDFPPQGDEHIQPILSLRNVTIERILSSESASPQGSWYNQESDEWVMLLQGAAGLRIEGETAVISLQPGEAVFLPAHLRHRVEWTAPGTLWLAVHISV